MKRSPIDGDLSSKISNGATKREKIGGPQQENHKKFRTQSIRNHRAFDESFARKNQNVRRLDSGRINSERLVAESADLFDRAVNQIVIFQRPAKLGASVMQFLPTDFQRAENE